MLKKEYQEREKRVGEWYAPVRFGLFAGGGDSSTHEPHKFSHNTVAESDGRPLRHVHFVAWLRALHRDVSHQNTGIQNENHHAFDFPKDQQIIGGAAWNPKLPFQIRYV